MTPKHTKEHIKEQGARTRAKTRLQNGKREERWTRTLDDLFGGRRYARQLTDTEKVSVADELSISTRGLDDAKLVSAIEEGVASLKAGATLEDLAEKGKGGNGSEVDYVDRVLIRKLTEEFGEEAPQHREDLYGLYGKWAVHAGTVLFQYKPDFYDALTDKLAEGKEVAAT